jgi:hypothetical protein
LAKKYSTCKSKIYLKIFWEYLVLIKDILIYDDEKLIRIRFSTASYLDGLLGIFDNKKAKKILALMSKQ